MSSIKSIYIVILACFIVTYACMNAENSSDKNEQADKPNTLVDYLGKQVLRDFIGSVTNENSKPIENVIITIGNKTTVTDSDGNFTIKSANVNEHFAYVEAKKEGYKKGALSLIPNDKTNTATLLLHKENEPCLFWFCKHNHTLPNSNN